MAAGDNPLRDPKERLAKQPNPGPKPGAPIGPRADAGDAESTPRVQTPRESAQAIVARTGADAKKLWNEAFDKTITDPLLVAQAAEYLFSFKEYAHAAEALKAGLRKGRTNGSWAFEALAIALQESQAAPAEIERAYLSLTDLEPTDPKAYLKAAQAVSELGHIDRAVAFCKRAADLEPNLPSPYANALVYAERATDVKADVVEWAAENLLRRDWEKDGLDYHARAKDKASKAIKLLDAAGRTSEADRLRRLITDDGQRDLVIELLWQGSADLDLVVAEPNGSVCSATHPRTTGGGVLLADILEQRDDNRAEIYAAASAFPGPYLVTVKPVLGRTTDGKARVQVTKFKGTPDQEIEIYSIDLANPQPVKVYLSGGSRTDLATVPPVDLSPTRRATTAAPRTVGPTLTAGAGAGGANLLNSPAAINARNALPVVADRQETRIDGLGGLPGLRVEARVSPDRSKVEVRADPVFAGPATDIPMPKVNLLPGSSE
jgi:tetratricopeptide (TPR) repeat protein